MWVHAFAGVRAIAQGLVNLAILMAYEITGPKGVFVTC